MTLPKPLIPSNVDLQDYTYMPLHVLRLRDSEFTSEVSAEAFRAGVLLWCTAWHQVPAGSLPNNDKTLSNMAGYGRVVKEWEKIKDEALHGWVLCDDNRWYHPVVCEVALESWLSKQEYNYKKFADRLRKRNVGLKEKHLPLVDVPLIEQWISAGMPSDWSNDSLNIPNERGDSSSGINKTSAGTPTENTLKEKKENIRESNINNKTLSLSESDSEESDPPKPPEHQTYGQALTPQQIIDLWQPDQALLAEHLKFALAQPVAPEFLNKILVKFNAQYEHQVLSENKKYSKLAGWIKDEQAKQANTRTGRTKTQSQKPDRVIHGSFGKIGESSTQIRDVSPVGVGYEHE